jgi:enamine deaminase RidA (YjgF/YER057c/UK114 family)
VFGVSAGAIDGGFMSERRSVSTESPYEPILGISRAVRIGSMIAVAGTAPLDAIGQTVGKGDPAAQARRCFEISLVALEQLGASKKDVFREVRPVNTIMQVSRFVDPDWLVETEVDAVVESR